MKALHHDKHFTELLEECQPMGLAGMCYPRFAIWEFTQFFESR